MHSYYSNTGLALINVNAKGSCAQKLYELWDENKVCDEGTYEEFPKNPKNI